MVTWLQSIFGEAWWFAIAGAAFVIGYALGSWRAINACAKEWLK